MDKKQVLKSKVYKTEADGSCINCGKKTEGVDKAIEMTYVFEHYLLQKIVKEFRECLIKKLSMKAEK